jgi:hypothetical protein
MEALLTIKQLFHALLEHKPQNFHFAYPEVACKVEQAMELFDLLINLFDHCITSL